MYVYYTATRSTLWTFSPSATGSCPQVRQMRLSRFTPWQPATFGLFVKRLSKVAGFQGDNQPRAQLGRVRRCVPLITDY